MKVLFEKSFGRDLKKIKDKRLFKQVQETIDQVESAASISDVSNMKKMQGFDTYYSNSRYDFFSHQSPHFWQKYCCFAPLQVLKLPLLAMRRPTWMPKRELLYLLSN